MKAKAFPSPWMRAVVVVPCLLRTSFQPISTSWVLSRCRRVGMAEQSRQHVTTSTSPSAAIVEGEATIADTGAQVFYNKVQVMNRDLSIAVTRIFHKKWCQDLDANQIKLSPARRALGGEGRLRILEALAATGLRSIRYAKEMTDLIHSIVANDWSEAAVDAIRRNVERNGVDPTVVQAHHGDASAVMYEHRKDCEQFDVIDVDPYGGANTFLDGAVQAVSQGGLLCVTCTDMAVLSGAHPEACFAKYGCMPVKGPFCHEMALRVLLASVESHANRYGRFVVPLLSVSADFYVRVFVRVFESKSEVKKSGGKVGRIFKCTGCGFFALEPMAKIISKGEGAVKVNPSTGPCVGSVCEHCGQKFHVGGPVWILPISDDAFVKEVTAHVETQKERYPSRDRLLPKLRALEQELLDVPLYYELPSLTHVLHCTQPPHHVFMSALESLGYKTSRSHASPKAIKTDAPAHVIWDILRCWVKAHPVKTLSDASPGHAILAKDPVTVVDIEAMEKESKREPRRVFYPMNPEAYWGPKTRAHGKKRAREDQEGSVEK